MFAKVCQNKIAYHMGIAVPKQTTVDGLSRDRKMT